MNPPVLPETQDDSECIQVSGQCRRAYRPPAAIAKDLFSRQRVDRWGFDMEILSIAQNLGIPIREMGITWRDMPGSRLRPLHDAIRTMWELVTIKVNLWSGIYE